MERLGSSIISSNFILFTTSDVFELQYRTVRFNSNAKSRKKFNVGAVIVLWAFLPIANASVNEFVKYRYSLHL